MLDVAQAGVEVGEVLVHLLKVAASVGGEHRDLLLHLGNHGGVGHRIDLVSRYQVSRSFLGMAG